MADEIKRVGVLSFEGITDIHAKGCRHAGNSLKYQAEPYEVVGRTRDEIAAEVMEDFIDEGSLSRDEAWEHLHFLPCSKL